ncbi:hypothetical protein GLOTRDRAFT_23493, partial [Gloeophyllum trabeum ATCC 11539]
IIDGRWHTFCGHFVGISTHRQDCQKSNCVFSRRHLHRTGCTSRSCIRLMDVPVRNPIRISPNPCPACT